MNDVNPNLKRAQSLVGTSSDGNRPDLDYYPTPPEGTRALLDRVNFDGLIWEPACGEGHMSEVIKSYGYDVFSTDLENREYSGMDETLDFMQAPLDIQVENIITNPPFSIVVDGKKRGCEYWVRKCLELTTGKVAILQKLAFLEGKSRALMFEETPLKTVYVFGPRLTMYRNGEKMKNSGMIPFAWYVWEHGYEGKPQIEWISELNKD